jgi:hypothetical protein
MKTQKQKKPSRYTTEFLLNNAYIVTELCIKSKEEYRLCQELKRISSLTETEVTKNINRDSSIEGVSIEGMKICIEDDKKRWNSMRIHMDLLRLSLIGDLGGEWRGYLI